MYDTRWHHNQYVTSTAEALQMVRDCWHGRQARRRRGLRSSAPRESKNCTLQPCGGQEKKREDDVTRKNPSSVYDERHVTRSTLLHRSLLVSLGLQKRPWSCVSSRVRRRLMLCRRGSGKRRLPFCPRRSDRETEALKWLVGVTLISLSFRLAARSGVCLNWLSNTRSLRSWQQIKTLASKHFANTIIASCSVR
jgi:hypothetical protein